MEICSTTVVALIQYLGGVTQTHSEVPGQGLSEAILHQAKIKNEEEILFF